MTPMALAMACKRSLEEGHGRLPLVVPGPPPRGDKIRIDRGRGKGNRGRCPRGTVLNWQDDPPRTVALFDAIDVLAWLHANGAVDVVMEPERAEDEK